MFQFKKIISVHSLLRYPFFVIIQSVEAMALSFTVEGGEEETKTLDLALKTVF
jgi:hypothetical protein